MTKNHLRIVLIGKTGAGKSATGNSILGRQDFDSSPGGDRTTYNCALRDADSRFDRNLIVVDSPGILEQGRDVKGEIRMSIDMTKPGPHAFLLCVNMGRITLEDKMTFEAYRKCFGPEMFKFTMIVFTHVDQWRQNMVHINRNPDLKTYIDTIPKFAKDFINDKGLAEFAFFDNRLTGTEMDQQVESILEQIEKKNILNGGTCYTEVMLKQAIKDEFFEKCCEKVFNTNTALALSTILGWGTVLYSYLRR